MVLKKHLKLQSLKKSLLSIYKKNKEKVFDIVLFGSILKEKDNVSDIDVAVVFKDKVDNDILKKIRSLNKFIHVDYLRLTELYSEDLWKTLIREGFSIVYKNKLSSVFNLKSYGLFTYDLRNVKRKSRFSQVLMGYKAESVLKKTNGEILRPGVILVPIDNVEYFRDFLNRWEVRYRLKYVFVE